MKVIDRNFIDIDDENVKKIYRDFLNIIIEYLKEKIDDEKIINDIIDNVKSVLIQITDGFTYQIKTPDGSFRKNYFPNSAGALKTNMIINANNEVLNIIPGVALRPNFTVNQLVHELLHALSSNQHSFFDENGITYTKTGTKIDFYDKNLDDHKVEKKISSVGLNEGITEFLTSSILKEYTENYCSMVVIASLLMESNDLLLKAYFSKDKSDLEKFYTDLEEKQELITREDLINLDVKENINPEIISKIIVGAIEYNKAYNNEISKEKYNSIISYLDKNDSLDHDSWDDLISKLRINKTM